MGIKEWIRSILHLNRHIKIEGNKFIAIDGRGIVPGPYGDVKIENCFGISSDKEGISLTDVPVRQNSEEL